MKGCSSTYYARAGLAAVLLAIAAIAAAAGPSAADQAALADFKLTADFLRRWEAYQEDVARQPCTLSPMLVMQGSGDKSLDQFVAEYDALPGVHAVLKRHDLTAREAILGMTTLMAAAAQTIAEQHPEMIKNGEIKLGAGASVSPENMEFYSRHRDEIRDHQMKTAREQLKRNGGQLPDCLSKAS